MGFIYCSYFLYGYYYNGSIIFFNDSTCSRMSRPKHFDATTKKDLL